MVTHPSVKDSRTEKQSQEEFDALMLQLFQEEVTSDGITMNYTLKDAAKYGIKEQTSTLGDFSLESMQKDLALSENWLASLESFDYDKLKEEQQLTYDVLRSVLKTGLETSDLLLYTEVLGPTTGTQTQLPVILSEYHFWDTKAVEDYLALLQSIPKYFEKIGAFEEQKAKAGLFMAKRTEAAIVSQCKEFIEKPDENLLIRTFESRLASLQLDSTQKQTFIEKNRKLVKELVIPAYQKLITVLEGLVDQSKNQKGLQGLPKGKQYYSYLLKSKVGTARDAKKIQALLDDKIASYTKMMSDCIAKDEKVYEKALQVKYPGGEPKETVSYLRDKCLKNFPALPDGVVCDLKYVDKSLENSISPAFYLTSPMDDYMKNVMYLNGSKSYDLTRIFTTIAHESYPGHLYQNVFYHAQNPAPIRSVISVGGYTEGWGTYAEIYSYSLAGMEENVQAFMKANTLLTLAIYAKADLEVHYNGWSENKLSLYLQGFGFDKQAAQTMFDAIVADPAGYMQYTLGYLEIDQMRQQAQEELGEKFSLKEFHRFFLSVGEAPFAVVQDRLEKWIQMQK